MSSEPLVKSAFSNDVDTFETFEQRLSSAVDAFKKGLAYLDSREYVLALKQFSIATDFDPESAFAFSASSIALTILGRHQEAWVAADEALKLSPNVSRYYFHRGRACYYLGRIADSIADYSSAIALRVCPWYYGARGLSYEAAQEFLLARQDLETAIGLAPKDFYILVSLAVLLSTCPDSRVRSPMGLDYAEEAGNLCRDENQRWQWLSALAAANAERGDFRSAVRNAEAALQCAPNEEKVERRKRLELYQKRKPYRRHRIDE